MSEAVADQVNTVKTRSASALDKQLSDIFGEDITELYSETSLTVIEKTVENNSNIANLAQNEKSETLHTNPEEDVKENQIINDIATMTSATDIKTSLDNLALTINNHIKEFEDATTAFRAAVY